MIQGASLYDLIGSTKNASQNELSVAIKKARQVARQMANHPEFDTRSKGEAMLESLRQAEEILLDSSKRADYDASLRSLESSPSTEPVRAGTAEKLATLRKRIERRMWEGTLLLAQEITDENPGVVEGWLLRAKVSFELRQLQDAKESVERYLQQVPNSPEGLRLLADTYQSLGEYEMALEIAIKIADREPTNEAFADVAKAFLRTNDLGRALRTHEPVVKSAKATTSSIELHIELLHLALIQQLGRDANSRAPVVRNIRQAELAGNVLRKMRRLAARLDRKSDRVEDWLAQTQDLLNRQTLPRWKVAPKWPYVLAMLLLPPLGLAASTPVSGQDLEGFVSLNPFWAYLFIGLVGVPLLFILRHPPSARTCLPHYEIPSSTVGGISRSEKGVY